MLAGHWSVALTMTELLAAPYMEIFFQLLFVSLILGILCLIRLCPRHPLMASELALANYTFVIIVLVNPV